jgi:large subunit ribosomal protein L25
MDKYTLKVEARKILGRKVKKLRAEGVLPANIYGANTKSQPVSVLIKEFEKVYDKVGETGLVELTIGKAQKPVLIHNVQVDPVEGRYLHADFLQVDLKKKVEASVPVEIVGESPAEKQGLGTVVVQLDEIEVEALPTDLPEKFEIDISNLSEVDQAVFVRDLKVDSSKVEIKNDPEEIVVKVEEQKEEKEEIPTVEETPVEEGAGETTVEGEQKGEEAFGEKEETEKEEK